MSITQRIDAVVNIPAESKTRTPPVPKAVKIDLMRTCNYRCGFCAHTRLDQQTGMMEWPLYTRIIDELVALGVEEVAPFFFGESFLHPKLAEAIAYAKRAGFKYVFLTTNGSVATPTKVEACMFGEMVQLVFNNWRPVTGGADGIPGIPALSILGVAVSTERRAYYLLLIVVVLLTLGAVRLRDSTFGRAFMAVRDNELAADVAGVPTTRVKTLAFVVSAMYAGLAGSLYAHLLRYISPDIFGFEQSLLMLSMLVIGGLGSLAGALVGAVVGVFVPELLRIFGVYYMAIYALLVVLAH